MSPVRRRKGFVVFRYINAEDVGVSKNSGTLKWMVYNGKPYVQMDDLGVPLFLETPMCYRYLCPYECLVDVATIWAPRS